MLGVSFQELMLVSVVALLVLGPNKLPGVLRSLGRGIRKLRRLTTEVRSQSGIDDVLRAEGLEGGISELRSLVRGGTTGIAGAAARMSAAASAPRRSPAGPKPFQPDLSREFPVEGPDAAGALPEDLMAGPDDDSEGSESTVAAASQPPSPSSPSNAPESSPRKAVPRPHGPRISTLPPAPAKSDTSGSSSTTDQPSDPEKQS